jgi:peptide/nickel transport system permease protein
MYVGGLMHGDLGRSYQLHTDVLGLVLRAAPATIELMVGAIFVSILIGVPAGIAAALKQNTFVDYVTIAFTSVGASAPVFWIALILVVIFAIDLRWLPTSNRIDIRTPFDAVTGFYVIDSLLTRSWQGFGDSLRHLTLPSIALGIGNGALIARITRAAMLEVLPQLYIMGARAKGLTERAVVLRHALRNALIPIITVVGLQIGYLLGGAVLTEAVFNWPGLGSLIVSRIGARDYPVVQGVVLFVGISLVMVNLLVDVLYAAVDPRVRYE